MKYLVFITSLLFCSTGFSAIKSKIDSKVYELKYDVTVKKPKEAFKELKVWIPVPQNTIEQELLSQKIEGGKVTIHEGMRYGNKMAFLKVGQNADFPLKLKFTWKVKRKSSLPTSKDLIRKFNDPKNFLGMNRKVPINGVIADIATDTVSSSDSNWTKIGKMYDYVVSKMKYDKSGKGWGEGDAIWACDNKRGNCTDFHSLLVGMARSQKIPAKFQIGLPTPPSGSGKIKGYHCWAKVYDQKLGWYPVDASESKKAQEARKYFGNLPANRIHFTTGRDLVLSPKQVGEPLNYFVYPYMELDGKKFSNYEKSFYVKSI